MIKNTRKIIPYILFFFLLAELASFCLVLLFRFEKNVMPEYTVINTVSPNKTHVLDIIKTSFKNLNKSIFICVLKIITSHISLF